MDSACILKCLVHFDMAAECALTWVLRAPSNGFSVHSGMNSDVPSDMHSGYVTMCNFEMHSDIDSVCILAWLLTVF